MSQLSRVLQKIFGSTGGSSEFGKVGSKAAGLPVTTKDLELIQSLPEYLLGLNAIVSDQGTSVLPYLEDMNSLLLLTTSQLAYLMQSGIPEWNAETEYYLDVSFVIDDGKIWKDTFGTGGTPNLNFQPSSNLDKWQQITEVGETDFSAKNLIINVASNTTVAATADSLKLLDANNNPALVKPVNLLFDIALHLMAGTSAKNSTWYWMWPDSLSDMLLVPDIEGATDGTAVGFLDDSTLSAVTEGWKAGDIVYNTTTFEQTTIETTPTVNGNPVKVINDIFTSGDTYKVHMLSPIGLNGFANPIGLVFRNGTGNFDDSGYARPQDQELREYNEETGELTITSLPTVVAFTEASAAVKQYFDFSKTPKWVFLPNVSYTVASGVRISCDLTFSGMNMLIDTPIYAGTRENTAFISSMRVLTIDTLRVVHASLNTSHYMYGGIIKCSKKPNFAL